MWIFNGHITVCCSFQCLDEVLFHTGPWMDIFGLGDAAKHIGTPQSIAIRNPDCSVATHLMNLVSSVNLPWQRF